MISNREYLIRLACTGIVQILWVILIFQVDSTNDAIFYPWLIIFGIFTAYTQVFRSRRIYIRKIREGDPNFMTFKAGMTAKTSYVLVQSSFRVPIIPLFFLPLIKSTLDEAEELKKQREQKEAKES